MAISDPRNPVLPSGQLSRAALEAMARQAGNDQATFFPGGSSYISAVGKVFIPDAAPPAAAATAVVRVTSATRNENLYYPALLCAWDQLVGQPGEVPTATEVWAQGPNNEDLDVRNYEARSLGVLNGDGKPVYEVDPNAVYTAAKDNAGVYQRRPAQTDVYCDFGQLLSVAVPPDRSGSLFTWSGVSVAVAAARFITSGVTMTWDTARTLPSGGADVFRVWGSQEYKNAIGTPYPATTTVLKLPRPGLHVAGATVVWGAGAGTIRNMRIVGAGPTFSGAPLGWSEIPVGGASASPLAQSVAAVPFLVGPTASVSVVLSHDAGAPLQILDGFFWVMKLG